MDKLDRIHQDKYNRLPDHDDRRKLLNPDAPSRLTTREGWSHSVMNHQLQPVTDDERNIGTIPPWTEMSNLSIEAVELEKPKAEYTELELKEKAIEKIKSISADFIVYTDGSTDSNQENGGAGIFAQDSNNNDVLEESKPAGKLCSSYGGESVALFHALNWMKQTTEDKVTYPDRLQFLVCTDSKSLCDALQNVSWKDRDYWIIKIQEQVLSLDADIKLLWIPSHCDVEGNERADELAKMGTRLCQKGVPISQKIVKAKIKNQKWKVGHARAGGIYGERRKPRIEIEKTWSRRVRTLYARIRTGHAKELKAYRHDIEKEDDPNCETCNVPEDTEHVLCHCAATEEARVRNWNGEVTMRMLVEQPDVCRKILGTRFKALVGKDE
jgi:ribonuclease HI